MLRSATVIVFWTLVWCGSGASIANTARAQDRSASMTTPDWGDYPMLMSQFGELCTMCEAYVRCSHAQSDQTKGEATITPPFNLYYFQTKTFWGQIATIWDYFAVWFDPVTSEKRPASIYRFSPDPSTNVIIPVTAYLSEEESRVDIDGTWINRDTAEWHALSGEKIGSCKRLGIPESMAMIAEHGNWTVQREDNPQ